MKDNNSSNKSIIHFWPNGIFENIETKKAPGSIPIGFSKLGYNVTIMLLKMKATNFPQDFDIIELFPTISDKLLHKVFESFNPIYNKRNLLSRFYKLIYSLIGSIKAVKIFLKKDSNLIFVEGADLPALFSVFIYRILSKIKYKNSIKKFVVKLDWDPDILLHIHKTKNILSVLFDLYYFLISIIFDIIIVETECTYNELKKLPFSEKLRIVPMGYANQKYENENAKREKIILSVARIAHDKGHDVLISSFKKVYSIHKDWELRIIGSIEDQEYYNKLKMLISELKLNDSVKLLGGVYGKTLEEEYKRASIFCLLERYEAFGIARVEAMSYGLPVITTTAGCGEQYSKYGSIIVPIEDTEKPAEAMLKLIENPNLRIEISKKQMDAIYSWDEVVKKIQDLI